ncbi:MAG: formylglycine-generating enzyme family protein [Myxococcales bacterium FL481]|nr:MAG: formylglycine-generating enzyme family protein [Myxococcales bacterium FL481]
MTLPRPPSLPPAIICQLSLLGAGCAGTHAHKGPQAAEPAAPVCPAVGSEAAHRPIETPLRGELFRVPVTSMNRIEGGVLGDRHIIGFWLDITEVTTAQYRDCVDAHVCPAPANTGEWSSTYGEAGKQNHPVNQVSWFNARTYCDWVGKRLPTEWEWEWAARGRDHANIYPWGNEPPTAASACWHRYDWDTDTGGGPCPVGTHNQTRDGIKDMAGNVWEWTASEFGDGRVVLRGGDWHNDDPTRLRAASRGKNTPYDRSSGGDGIRCASSTPPGELTTRIAPVHDG